MIGIEKLLNNVEKYNDMIIQKRYKSKKNIVAYVILNGKPRLIKWFLPGYKRKIENEYSILKLDITELSIPKILEFDTKNNVLIMNNIFGENLCDLINNDKIIYNEKKNLIILLSKWFINFHKYFSKSGENRLRGDSILRNFIFSDRIWGVDFEDSQIGNPIEDIASMCVSILTTNPMFNFEKINLCNIFIKSYFENQLVNNDDIFEEILYCIKKINLRRPLLISENEINNIVNKILF